MKDDSAYSMANGLISSGKVYDVPRKADALFGEHPLIRRIRFHSPGSMTHEHLDFPLEPKGYYPELLRVPQISGLEALSFSDSGLGNVEASAIADSVSLRNLKMLDFSSNDIADEGVDALIGSTNLSQLNLLDLSHNPIGEVAAASVRARFGERVRLNDTGLPESCNAQRSRVTY